LFVGNKIVHVEILMRELRAPEIGAVAGGEDDPLVMPSVTVLGKRIQPNSLPYEYQTTADEFQDDGGLSFGPGGAGGGGFYDPSPDDGVPGIAITQNDDGSFSWEIERDGWLDWDNNGVQGALEPGYKAGEHDTTENGWGSDWQDAYDLLHSFKPFPPGHGV
jgi:hypothetical protein